MTFDDKTIAELKRLAEAATPGPWKVQPEEQGKPYIRVRGTVLGTLYKIANVCLPAYQDPIKADMEEAQANAAFIAAADPAAILSLIAHIEELQAERESLVKKALEASEKACAELRRPDSNVIETRHEIEQRDRFNGAIGRCIFAIRSLSPSTILKGDKNA